MYSKEYLISLTDRIREHLELSPLLTDLKTNIEDRTIEQNRSIASHMALDLVLRGLGMTPKEIIALHKERDVANKRPNLKVVKND